MTRNDLRPISARPTVRIDGMQYPLLSANIQNMTMREAVGGLSSLELGFVDWISRPDGSAGFGAVGDSPLKLGAAISLYAGDATGPQEIFAGRITAIESEVRPIGAPLFTVLAEDGLFDARRTRRRRTFEDMSPADVARTIAQDHGLTPEIRDGLDTPVTLWAQMNESDLAFLRRVLARVDADVQIVGGAMQVGPLARDRRSEVDLNYPRDLLSARVTADLAEQTGEARVGSFDPATGEAVLATADRGELGPGQGRDGATELGEHFADFPVHVGSVGPLTQGEADLLAEAEFGRRARRFVQVDGTAQGNPAVRVGSWVTLTGVNPMFENKYLIVGVTHRYDSNNGYLTEFLGECAYLGAAA